MTPPVNSGRVTVAASESLTLPLNSACADACGAVSGWVPTSWLDKSYSDSIAVVGSESLTPPLNSCLASCGESLGIEEAGSALAAFLTIASRFSRAFVCSAAICSCSFSAFSALSTLSSSCAIASVTVFNTARIFSLVCFLSSSESVWWCSIASICLSTSSSSSSKTKSLPTGWIVSKLAIPASSILSSSSSVSAFSSAVFASASVASASALAVACSASDRFGLLRKSASLSDRARSSFSPVVTFSKPCFSAATCSWIFSASSGLSTQAL